MRATDCSDYTEYVQASWPRLFRTAYALTGDVNRAEDLLQGTLVKVFVNWRKVASADTPDAYVRRVMVNEVASFWRSRRRRPEVLAAEPRASLHPQANSTVDADLATSDELWKLVQTLPPRQRAVIVLRYYEELSERETAWALGIAQGTVKSLSNAAMSKLRGALSDTTKDHSSTRGTR